jgi:hypothetical protein
MSKCVLTQIQPLVFCAMHEGGYRRQRRSLSWCHAAVTKDVGVGTESVRLMPKTLGMQMKQFSTMFVPRSATANITYEAV